MLGTPPLNQTSPEIYVGDTQFTQHIHRPKRVAIGLVIFGIISLLSLAGTTVSTTVLATQQSMRVGLLTPFHS